MLGSHSSAHTAQGQRPGWVRVCPKAVQLEMQVPAGLSHKNTVRSKVLQVLKFREMSGKSLVGVPEQDT